MLGSLIAYDASGMVVASLDWLTLVDDLTGEALGAVDFTFAEAEGVPLSDLWTVHSAVASASWPQWLPADRLIEFEVDVDNRFTHPLRRLVHRGRPEVVNPDPRFRRPAVAGSGHMIEREPIDQAVASRISATVPDPADIRDLVGGPDFPLRLNERGEIVGRALHETPNRASMRLSQYLAKLPQRDDPDA